MTTNTETPFPTQTPNVALENPAVRRVLGWVLGVGGVVIPVVTAVDAASNDFDLTRWTNPISAGFLALFGIYQLAVTNRNIPG
jgi:hypothetical protein